MFSEENILPKICFIAFLEFQLIMLNLQTDPARVAQFLKIFVNFTDIPYIGFLWADFIMRFGVNNVFSEIFLMSLKIITNMQCEFSIFLICFDCEVD
jgi:hypothetical protein